MREEGKKPDPGKKPELRWIKLSQLYVPSGYQRSIKSDASAKNINHIKSNFTWAECGALIVCPDKASNPPQFAIVDGQHRFRAAEGHGGITELPCIVIEQSDLMRQATNFVNINSKRVKLHPLHQYNAAVVSGDPDAVALAALLEKANIAIAAHAFSGQETPARVTQAVGTLLRMIQDYSEKQIIWALTIIPEAYGDMKGMLRSNLIRALAEFIKAKPDTKREAMVVALQEIDVDDMERNARAYRSIEGGSMREAIIKVLEREYNAATRAA